MKDENKTKERLIAELKDLRGQVERRLREGEAEHRRLLENLPIGVANTAPGGEVLYHNAHARKMLGYELKELGRLRAEDLYVNPGDCEDLTRNLKEKGVHSYEYQLRQKDGRVVWVRGTTRAIEDEEGKIVRFQGILEDVTERKRQEMEAAALQKVRDAVWAMRSADDIENMVMAIKEGLTALEIPFLGLGVNVVEREWSPSDAPLRMPGGRGQRPVADGRGGSARSDDRRVVAGGEAGVPPGPGDPGPVPGTDGNRE